MKTNIERYLENALMHICDRINERLRKFVEDYNKKQFGKQFFLDIEVRNVLCDLMYYRDEQLKAHLQICRQYRLSEDSFAIKHAKHYLRRLDSIELKSFVQIIKIVKPWFGFSEAKQKEMNEELCRIAKEVVEEMKAEECTTN